MPKEVTHILFADACADLAAEAGAPWFGGLLAGDRATFHYGAIAPDTFFYAVPRPLIGTPRPWGEIVHGERGEDTAASIIELARRLRAAGPKDRRFAALAAFTAGYVTHMALDQSMHPWVYAFAGQYYDGDAEARRLNVTRHRVIEAWLDLRVAAKHGRSVERFPEIAALRRAGRTNRLALHAWGEAFRTSHGINDQVWPDLRRGYRVHIAVLGLTAKIWAVRIAEAANGALGGRLAPTVALFYPLRRDGGVPGDWLEQSGFVHPATGLTQPDDFEALWRNAQARALHYIGAVERYLIGQGDIAELRRDLPGYGLSMGLPGFVTAQAEHFRPLPIEPLWQYRGPVLRGPRTL